MNNSFLKRVITFFAFLLLSNLQLVAQTYRFDTGGDVEGFVIHTGETTVMQATEAGTDGVLVFTTPNTYNPTSLRVDQTTQIDANTNKFIRITLKNNTDAHQLRLRPTIDGGFIEVTRNLEINSNEFKTYTLNMTNNALWTGMLNPVYFQFRIVGRQMPITGTSIIIDEIAFTSTLSTQDIVKNDSSIKLYPNPVQSELKVDSKQIISKIEVYNLLGQKVLVSKNSKILNVRSLHPGLYVTMIFQDTGVVSTKRFIKE